MEYATAIEKEEARQKLQRKKEREEAREVRSDFYWSQREKEIIAGHKQKIRGLRKAKEAKIRDSLYKAARSIKIPRVRVDISKHKRIIKAW